MKNALRAYGEVLRLVRLLPQDSRGYYAKYARENFVNYRDADPNDTQAIQELLHRTYIHSIWVLNKVKYLFICKITNPPAYKAGNCKLILGS